ncbi:murein biosynthesis integral membrane protein MurJ [Spirilliplanes yamanashiensis]|uniref:Murein biosynthesis integral membrane protein MurJ n=1 Tax=Spirilliplanes yamanashiensis TaxID=42233 RepID=A0A8J3Y674_9ACTN|nr:murein biosynthesis integral membrane protein MurJ [Spirilliplanes yamanashiensis]MDP9814932.1 putative peptidoglycan lipid II flippase [Spirilliplanes yamanashiensis]GIJ02586.1 hypothetical protein Sya03_19380 [Spirilliplanes yamanashiensis]
MTGGLYRSAHAARDGDPPQAEPVEQQAEPVEQPADHQEAPLGTPPGQEVADEGGSTASNSIVMAAGSLVSRLTGFLRTVLIGAALGGAVGGVGDAYTTAQMLPGQIYELLLGGVLSSVLVPMLVRRRKAEPDGGEAYTQKLLTVALLGLGLAAALAVLAAPLFTAVYASDRPAQYRDLVTVLSYLVLPMIFFTGMSALIGAVLNVRGHFAAPMWSPILNNLVVIAACGVYIGVFTGEVSPAGMTPERIAVIGGGTLLGIVVQACGLLPALRKVGFRWRFRWDPRSLGLGELARLGAWMLCYVAANQVAVFVVVKLLNSADSGAGLLIYNNVFLLVMMAHGIIGVSVMTALLPRMSAAAAEGRLPDLVADLSRGLRTVTAALAPIVVGYAVLAAPIAVVLFQHGAFGAEEARATTGVLVMGAFAVLPLSVSYLCTYTFYALQGNKTVALINLPVVGVRVAAQLSLFALLPPALTAVGLTLGNALSYAVSGAISLVVLRRRIGRIGLRTIATSLSKVFLAAAVAAGLGLLVVRLLPGGGLPSFWEALLQLAVGGVVIVGTYLGLALALRVREVTSVLTTVRRKLGR